MRFLINFTLSKLLVKSTSYNLQTKAGVKFFSQTSQSATDTSNDVINTVIKIREYPIHYVKVGHGPKVVFCLPGILGNTKIHTVSLVKNFDKDKFTFISWDQPGYGKSSPPERQLHDGSLTEDREIMVELMDKLGYQKYSVMGWSGGGCSALMAAIRYPEIVQKLIVWGAFSYVNEEDAKIYKAFESKENQRGKMMEILVQEYGEEFFQKHFGGWMHLFYRINSIHGGEFISKQLHKIKCPTLILHGKDDGLVLPRHGEFLKDNIADSRLILWERAKHNLHLRYPDEFNKVVAHFLSSDAYIAF